MLGKFVIEQVNDYARKLEEKLDGDVIFYFGPTHSLLIKAFRDQIERLAADKAKRKRLCIFLRTNGGAVEPVEKMVEIVRHHYAEVWFFVPDYAMSAGTIFCLSGDKIFMDYSSSLGPIDPQVNTNDNGQERWVPALGVLEQVDRMVEKSRNGTISPAEFAILQSQNLAVLASYEHAKDLSIDLAQKWLVKYKFRNWNEHRTDPILRGQPVTAEQKSARAIKIVSDLAKHDLWHSHGRFIGSKMLSETLRLEIDDYPDDARGLIRSYNDLLTDHVEQQKFVYYLHDKLKTAEG